MSDVQRVGDLDRRILEYAAIGHSPDEISRMLGHVLSPAKVAIRTHQLLESPDNWLSIPEQINLNLRMLRETLSELRSRYLDLDNAKVQLTYMKEISAQLEKIQSSNRQDLDTYNQMVGRAMVAAYDIALAHIGGVLRDRIEPEEWSALKREALEVAQAEVARRQVEA